jgi:hypothetical protein
MLAVVAYDAGGAELLSSFVRRQGLQPLFVLDGPARKVFERKLGPVTVVPLDDALEACVSLLCGTSGQSDLEFRALGVARARGKHSAAFVDHWINFPQRFTRGNRINLPDEVWVGWSPIRISLTYGTSSRPCRRAGRPEHRCPCSTSPSH